MVVQFGEVVYGCGVGCFIDQVGGLFGEVVCGCFVGLVVLFQCGDFECDVIEFVDEVGECFVWGFVGILFDDMLGFIFFDFDGVVFGDVVLFGGC